MLEDFGDYWGNRYPPIVVYVCTIPSLIFDKRYHEPKSELAWNKCMPKHLVKKIRGTDKKVEGGIVKVFYRNAIRVCTFFQPSCRGEHL